MDDGHKHPEGWRLPAREPESLVETLLIQALAKSHRQRFDGNDGLPAGRDGSEPVLSKDTPEKQLETKNHSRVPA